jgi:hypothetical protein
MWASNNFFSLCIFLLYLPCGRVVRPCPCLARPPRSAHGCPSAAGELAGVIGAHFWVNPVLFWSSKGPVSAVAKVAEGRFNAFQTLRVAISCASPTSAHCAGLSFADSFQSKKRLRSKGCFYILWRSPHFNLLQIMASEPRTVSHLEAPFFLLYGSAAVQLNLTFSVGQLASSQRGRFSGSLSFANREGLAGTESWRSCNILDLILSSGVFINPLLESRLAKSRV